MPQGSQGTLESDRPLTPSDSKDHSKHQIGDPICAALYAESMTSPPPSVSASAAKCPIRYMDQHSPEEIAQYFETHKHEIPRSHEICVKRYQRNEDDIRKLDAKYGNLVSMIQGLGHKHQPMLPTKEEEEALEAERLSDERVENWAHAVSADGVGQEEEVIPADLEDRESRFDRPLKEIRVGESPSRPWGISVPIFDPPEGQRPISPPPAPVSAGHGPRPVGKCPFGHGQQSVVEEQPAVYQSQERPAGKCPISHAQMGEEKDQMPHLAPQHAFPPQPTFIAPPQPPNVVGGSVPQMVFNGPVFIGYPIEQAMAFMTQYSRGPY